MPDRAILAYYSAVADKILPFLRGRRVGVRHTFDHTPVFRRHLPSGRWITIPTKRILLEIVRQHGYEFFPHLEGEKDLWFALDIDVRAVPLPLGKLAVRTTLDVLDERGVKYLLKFSGGNGFHIQWAFRPTELPRDRWGFTRRIVRNIRTEVERRLQEHPQRDAFYFHIPQKDPITELNAVDKEAQKSVLFDELILKRNATIRAPFSLHMGHDIQLPKLTEKLRKLGSPLVAVPIEPRRLEAFVPGTDATIRAALLLPRVRIPVNPVSLFRRPPWRE